MDREGISTVCAYLQYSVGTELSPNPGGKYGEIWGQDVQVQTDFSLKNDFNLKKFYKSSAAGKAATVIYLPLFLCCC